MSEMSLEQSINTIIEIVEEAKLSENNKQKIEDLLYALIILRRWHEMEKEETQKILYGTKQRKE